MPWQCAQSSCRTLLSHRLGTQVRTTTVSLHCTCFVSKLTNLNSELAASNSSTKHQVQNIHADTHSCQALLGKQQQLYCCGVSPKPARAMPQ